MGTRLLILLALIALMSLGWLLLRGRQRRQIVSLAAERPFGTLIPAGLPAVVAFTLPSCVSCRTQQKPALERLQAQLGDTVTITTLSADEHGELTAQLGILTVPSSVVLGADGTVRALNQGFADTARLREQLASVLPTGA